MQSSRGEVHADVTCKISGFAEGCLSRIDHGQAGIREVPHPGFPSSEDVSTSCTRGTTTPYGKPKAYVTFLWCLGLLVRIQASSARRTTDGGVHWRTRQPTFFFPFPSSRWARTAL